jgi:uncharacterized protein YqhQ
MRPIPTVLTEALVVGFILYLIFSATVFIVKPLGLPKFLTVILSGALAHLMFEYGPFGNVNRWWCEKTFSA